MAHPLQQKKLLISVAKADLGPDAEASLTEGYCTMVAGPHRCTTRNVTRSRSGSLVWGSGSGAELFLLSEDDLLVTELRLGFELWSIARKWGGDSHNQAGQAELHLGEHILEQLLGGCTADVRLPLLPYAKGRTWTGAAKQSSTDALGSLLLHMQLQPADADVDAGLGAQLPVDAIPRLLVDATRLAPGSVLHCTPGVLYTEPCYVYLRFKLVSATGLGRSTQPVRPAGSKPSQLSTQLVEAALAADQAAVNRGGGTAETPVGPSPAAQRLAFIGSQLQNQAVQALGKASTMLDKWRGHGGAARGKGDQGSAGEPPASASARSSANGMAFVEGGNGSGGWGLVPGRGGAHEEARGEGAEEGAAQEDSGSASSWDLQNSGVASPLGQSPPTAGAGVETPTSPRSPQAGGRPTAPTAFAAVSTTALSTSPGGQVTGVHSHDQAGANTVAIPPHNGFPAPQSQQGSPGQGQGPVSRSGSLEKKLGGGGVLPSKSGVLKAEAMLAALEENGFSVADSKASAAFFWCKVSYEGQYHTTRMVPVDQGTASWGESFVVAALRPIGNAPLEVELSGSNDAKTRGKVICQLSAPLATLMAQPTGPKDPLLPPTSPNPGSAASETGSETACGTSGREREFAGLPDYHPNRWPRGTIMLQTKLEDRTCEVTFEVDVVEPDLRATEAGVALLPEVLVREASSSTLIKHPSPGAPAAEKAPAKPEAPATPTDPLSPRPSGGLPASLELQPLHRSPGPPAPPTPGGTPDAAATSPAPPDSPLPTSSAGALATAMYTADGVVSRSAAAVVASAAGTVAAVASTAAEAIGLPVPTGPGSPMPGLRAPYSPVATLALIVHEFEVERLDSSKAPQKPTASSDFFFMLQCGPAWGCSSTVTAAATATWQWGMLLPLAHASTLLSIALFKRHDQSAGRKVMNVKTMMGNTQDLVGKLRVRASTLAPGKLTTVTLPIWAERNGTRPGARMGTCQLSLCLSYPALWPYLNAYLQVPSYMSVVMLQNGAVAGQGACDLLPKEDKAIKVEAETLQRRSRRVLIRWLEESSPSLPGRSARRLLDDGRQEFNLTRTQQNWRRVSRAAAAFKPMGQWWYRVQMWENPLLTLAIACLEVCLVAWPSKVFALLVLALVVYVWQHKNKLSGQLGHPPAMVEELGEDDDNVETSSGGLPSQQSQGRTLQHEDSGVSTSGPSSSGQGSDTGPTGLGKNAAPEVPLDPFNALKQNYDGLVLFMISVQNALDNFAGTLERLQALLTWQDPFATGLATAGLVMMAVLMWHAGLRVLMAAALLFDIRPPRWRWPLPPPPANVVAYLPCRADLMM